MRKAPEAEWSMPCLEDFDGRAEIFERAVRPYRIRIMMDPETQDRLIVYYVDGRPPIVIRMTATEILRARAEFMKLEVRYLI